MGFEREDTDDEVSPGVTTSTSTALSSRLPFENMPDREPARYGEEWAARLEAAPMSDANAVGEGRETSDGKPDLPEREREVARPATRQRRSTPAR